MDLRPEKKAVGQCFNPASSDDGTHELIIDMRLDDKKEISHTLAHEMIHAIVGTKCGHRGPFKMLATEIGLVGPMTASIGGPQFFEVVDPILDAMGDYPHAALSRGTTVGKQSTRLIKAFCPHCGYTARITRKWIDDVGPPHCPLHGEMAIKV